MGDADRPGDMFNTSNAYKSKDTQRKSSRKGSCGMSTFFEIENNKPPKPASKSKVAFAITPGTSLRKK